MELSESQNNVCRLYISENKPIVVGYALDKSGFWFKHTWTLEDKDGDFVVVETTKPNLLYYGIVLDKAMSEGFFLEYNTMI